MKLTSLTISLWVLLSATACSLVPHISGFPSNEPTRTGAGTGRKRVLVLPFTNRSEFQDEALQRAARLRIEEAVLNQADWALVRESDLTNPEKIYSAAGEYHFRRVFEQAREASITGVILGRIDSVVIHQSSQDTGLLGGRQQGAEAQVHFELYDVATETQVFSRTATGNVNEEKVSWLMLRPHGAHQDDAKEAVNRAVDKILASFAQVARRLAWEGRIARVELNRYFVTGGSQTGVRPGSLLRVYGPGFPVTDPKTQSSLGLAPGPFKGLLKVTQTFGEDSAVAVLHTGGGFREQDRVEVHTATP